MRATTLRSSHVINMKTSSAIVPKTAARTNAITMSTAIGASPIDSRSSRSHVAKAIKISFPGIWIILTPHNKCPDTQNQGAGHVGSIAHGLEPLQGSLAPRVGQTAD